MGGRRLIIFTVFYFFHSEIHAYVISLGLNRNWSERMYFKSLSIQQGAEHIFLNICVCIRVCTDISFEACPYIMFVQKLFKYLANSYSNTLLYLHS